jgi:hypothetical protein
MDFASLQHTRVRKSTRRGGSTSRYVPPSGFGYPLDGLLLPSPCRPYFVPAALMGFTLRSIPLSKGIRTFPPGSTHLPFLPPVAPSPKRRPVPKGRGSWALTLSRVPCGSNVCLRRRLAGYSLGFPTLPGHACDSLDRDPSQSPLTRFADLLPEGSAGGAPECQSALAWPCPSSTASRRFGTRQPS